MEVSKRVYDLSEYLIKLNNEGRLNKNFKVDVGRVAYHQPCHLKYQAIGAKSVELLRLAGAQVVFIEQRLFGPRRGVGDEEGIFQPGAEGGARVASRRA